MQQPVHGQHVPAARDRHAAGDQPIGSGAIPPHPARPDVRRRATPPPPPDPSRANDGREPDRRRQPDTHPGRPSPTRRRRPAPTPTRPQPVGDISMRSCRRRPCARRVSHGAVDRPHWTGAVRRARPGLARRRRHLETHREDRRARRRAAPRRPRRDRRRRRLRHRRHAAGPDRRRLGDARPTSDPSRPASPRSRSPTCTPRSTNWRRSGASGSVARRRAACCTICWPRHRAGAAADPRDPRRRAPAGRARRCDGGRRRQGGRRVARPRSSGRRCSPARSPRRPRVALTRGQRRPGGDRAHTRPIRCSRCWRHRPTSVADALAGTGLASVEWKLDGARIQAHRADGDVRLYTRNLNDVTDRLGGVVDVVARPARRRPRARRRGARRRRRRHTAPVPGHDGRLRRRRARAPVPAAATACRRSSSTSSTPARASSTSRCPTRRERPRRHRPRAQPAAVDRHRRRRRSRTVPRASDRRRARGRDGQGPRRRRTTPVAAAARGARSSRSTRSTWS